MTRWEQEEAEQQAHEAQMQAMYDEQQREQQLEEQVTQLQEEVARLKAENEVLRQERLAVVAWLRREANEADHYARRTGSYTFNESDAYRDAAEAIYRSEHLKEREE